MSPEEAAQVIVNERAKLSRFEDHCREWIKEAREGGACEFETVGCQLRHNYEDNRPSRRVQLARSFVRATVEELIRCRWSAQNFKVEAYGSTVSGIDDADSDLDLIVIDPARPQGVGMPQSSGSLGSPLALPEWYDPRVLADVLRQAPANLHIKDILALAHARVPMVKLSIDSYGIEIKVDLVVNARLALENTKLINAYCNLRPALVRPLAYNLKQWLRSRGLNDPSARQTGQHSLSSYAITLLAIEYLQHERQLPNLQNPELLERLEVPSNTLWTGFEPRRPSEGCPDAVSGDKVAMPCDASFFNPSDPERMKNVRIMQENESLITGFRSVFSSHRFPCTFKNWVEDGADFRQEHIAARNLPSPNGVGFHLRDSQSPIDRDVELGFAYRFFVILLFGELEREVKPIFDVTRDVYLKDRRIVNLPDGFACTNERGRDFGIQNVIRKDPLQPLEWRKQPLVIRDPFITNLNIARNLKPPAFARLRKKVRRVFELVSADWHNDDLNLARMHRPWKLDVALWELRARQAAGVHRGESVCSLFSTLG